jgi:putative membrane protein
VIFLFTIKGSVFGQLWKWGLVHAILAAIVAVSYKHTNDDDFWNDIKIDTHKLLITPIAFLLVFRSNVAYGRFWEGRGHMGAFYKELRDIARKANTLIMGDDELAHRLRSNICRFLPVLAITTKYNLRKRSAGLTPEEVMENFKNEIMAPTRPNPDDPQNPFVDPPYLTPEEMEQLIKTPKNKPYRVINWIGQNILAASKAGKLEGGPPTYAGFDNACGNLILTWMGMNKICFTPTPFPYIHMLNWFLMIWLATLSFPLVTKIGYWVIIAMPLLSMGMYAIEEVAEEIEDPFGDDLNDLPTETIGPGINFDNKLAIGYGVQAILSPQGKENYASQDEKMHV